MLIQILENSFIDIKIIFLVPASDKINVDVEAKRQNEGQWETNEGGAQCEIQRGNFTENL